MQMKPESAVVAEFRGFPEAEAAVGELAADIFAEHHIYVTCDLTQARAPAHISLRQYAGAGRYETDIRCWLESIFGQNAGAEQENYQNAVHVGRVLVGVTTPEQLLDTAADILKRHSPLHVRQKPAAEFIAMSTRTALSEQRLW
jgi:hypothetical protein